MSAVFWALVVLGVLIFVHELGHFLAARLFGVRVLVFSLGFGPRLGSWRLFGGDTEYQLSAIPFGGYVKMLGEGEGEGGEEVPITEADRPFSFAAKGVGPRLAIVAAGPIFNFVFAAVALVLAHLIGYWVQVPEIGSVSPGTPAEASGLRPGDRVLEIDGRAIDSWELLKETVMESDGSSMSFVIEREGKQIQVAITPRFEESKNIFGESIRSAQVGILPVGRAEAIKYGLVESLHRGIGVTGKMIALTGKSVWMLVTGGVSADQIAGPLMIADQAGQHAQEGASRLLVFMAFISVNLGLLNLLPIPVLDGGHLLFFTIEAVKGSPLSDRAQGVANRIGLVFLLALMLLALKNDIVRMVPWEKVLTLRDHILQVISWE
ncbi:MAG: RIP metalloprotease RseP [Magnetococcales bacterium]|nr:RIP metalloprotease RseP [Magnetococcales bacterium]MBF0155963.1 RIP metalloprotease RseP [Magnetococcales bacterium]